MLSENVCEWASQWSMLDDQRSGVQYVCISLSQTNEQTVWVLEVSKVSGHLDIALLTGSPELISNVNNNKYTVRWLQ